MDSAITSPVSIQVSNLKIQGFVNKTTKVANYLGIQYGSIPARFRQSKPINLSELSGDLDATNFGPRCPQFVLNRPETAHLHEGIHHSQDSGDEFGCLRLNIYVPDGVEGPLPVVVWIHGGGFIFGDGGPEYDGNLLVQHSVEKGKPIVFVAINYRLGLFGFLSSKELKAEAEAAGETPFANMSMHDQRVALLWIQKHIQHFSGDPGNVTIAGESAGGWSVLAQLRSDVPVCQRGIILSSPNLEFPTPQEVQETFDEFVAGAGGAVTATSEEKLKAIRSLDAQEVVKLMGPRFGTPVYDENWFVYQDGKQPIAAGPAQFGPWVKGVVAGSTRDEAALFGLAQWRTWTSQQFADRVKSSFPDAQLAQEMADAYGISPDAPAEKCLKGMVAMTTDSLFSGLPYSVAEVSSKSTPVSVYRFDQIDIFPQSPYNGYAYHALDNAFFCRYPAVASPKANPGLRETSDRYSQMILQLAHGSQPWPAYHDKQSVMVFNGKDTDHEEVKEKDRWRRITTSGDLTRAKGTWRSGNKLVGVRHLSMDKT